MKTIVGISVFVAMVAFLVWLNPTGCKGYLKTHARKQKDPEPDCAEITPEQYEQIVRNCAIRMKVSREMDSGRPE